MMSKQKTFSYWQWKTIIVLMAGYAIFYLVRKNFSFAMPSLNAEFGIDKVQLGLFLTLHGVIYGFSRFFNGILVDKGSARKIMSLGLLLCGVTNLFFGCSDWAARWISAWGDWSFTVTLVYLMGIMWVINGFLQGMGFPPCSKILTHWIHPNELATKMSVWNMSHSIGAGIAMALCGWLLIPHFGWRWCFIVPGVIAVLSSFWLYLTIKDSPTDAGFEEVAGGRKEEISTPEQLAEHKAFVNQHVYRSRIIWTLALCNFFVYVIRFSALDWGPTLLTESKGLSLATATILCVIFELVGGNLGMIAAGWATDHIFHSKAHHTCVFCLVGAALSIIVFALIPGTAPWWVLLIPYSLMGFFIYGPQALIGICTANHATKRASATANGLVGIFGYLSTIVSGVGFGYVAQHFGWSAAYVTIFTTAIIGILLFLTIWKAPANGYEE